MGGLSWILLGIVAGWVASFITRRMDLIGLAINVVVGVIGAAAGGFAANLVTRHPVFGFNLQSIFVALLGTLVFLAVANAVQRR